MEKKEKQETEEIQETKEIQDEAKLSDEIDVFEIEEAKGEVESRNRKELYDNEEIVIKGDTASEVGYIILGILVVAVILYVIFSNGGDNKSQNGQDENSTDESLEIIRWQEELKSGVLKTEFTDELLMAIGGITTGDYWEMQLLIEGAETYDEESVIKHIYEKLEKYTRYEVVDKKASYGDTVNINYDIFLDGEMMDDLSIKDFNLTLGSGTFILGVEEALVGVESGDEVKVEVTFAQESSIEVLAGQSTVVVVTVNSVLDEIKLELIDENVAYLSSTAKSINEYIDELKVELEEGRYDLSDDAIRAQVWNKFIADVSVENYPEDVIQGLVDKKKQVYIDQAEAEKLNFDYFLKIKNMTEEELDERLHESAKKEYLEQLVIYYMVGVERLVPTEEEYELRLAQLLKEAGYASLEDAKAIGYEVSDIEQVMLKDIVLSWLAKRVEIITE